jgi:hypothetical protein
MLDHSRYKNAAGHIFDLYLSESGGFLTFAPKMLAHDMMSPLNMFFIGDRKAMEGVNTQLKKNCSLDLYENVQGMVFERPEGKITTLQGTAISNTPQGQPVMHDQSTVFVVPKFGDWDDVENNYDALMPRADIMPAIHEKPLDFGILNMASPETQKLFTSLLACF